MDREELSKMKGVLETKQTNCLAISFPYSFFLFLRSFIFYSSSVLFAVEA